MASKKFYSWGAKEDMLLLDCCKLVMYEKKFPEGVQMSKYHQWDAIYKFFENKSQNRDIIIPKDKIVLKNRWNTIHGWFEEVNELFCIDGN